MRRSPLLVMAIVVLAGCATIPPASERQYIQATIERVTTPAIGESAEAELGNAILKVVLIKRFEGIELRSQAEHRDSGVLFRVLPQTLVASNRDAEFVYYSAPGGVQCLKTNGIYQHSGGICVPIAGGDPMIYCTDAYRMDAYKYPISQKPDFTVSEMTRVLEDGFKKELIYNGRSGSQIKFLYCEIAGGSKRDPLSQEVIYDLGEGKVIGFKGARVEVLDADNQRIRYKVLSYFE